VRLLVWCDESTACLLSRVDSHNQRWRFAMMAFMSLFAQLSGNSVLTYYLPSMYTQLGISSTERRLLLTFANSIVSCAGAVAGSATNDRIGRRTKLWVGSIVLACLFAGVTGFSSQFVGSTAVTHPALSNAGVAFVRPRPRLRLRLPFESAISQDAISRDVRSGQC
jgi:MFS family permease